MSEPDVSAEPEIPEPRLPSERALTRAALHERLGAEAFAQAMRQRSWVELFSGVYVPCQRRDEPLARASAALLRAGPGSVLSGLTAAAMHGCRTARDWVIRDRAIHVTTPYDRQVRSEAGLVIRQAWVRESEVLELDGLRVYALEVALSELLCTGPQRLALACVEEAFAQLSHRAERLRALISERLARRRDRRGTRRAANLLKLAHPAAFAT